MSLDTDVLQMTHGFGSVTVTWNGDAARGLFNVGSVVVGDGVGQFVRRTERTLVLAASEVPDDAAVGDTITIDGTDYKVREFYADDGDERVTLVTVAK